MGKASTRTDESLSTAAIKLRQWGLVVACVLVPVAFDPWGFNPFGPTKVFVLSIAAGMLGVGLALDWRNVFSQLKQVFCRSTSAWVLSAFVGLTLLSTVVSLDASQSVLGSYPEYMGVVACAFFALAGLAAAVEMRDPDARRLFGRALAFGVGAIALYGVMQAFGLDVVEYRVSLDLARARSTLGNASNLGLYLALAIPLLLGQAQRETEQSWKTAMWAVSGLAFVALLATSSRGAWFALLAATVVWLILAWPVWGAETRRRAAMAVGISLVAMAVAFGVVFPSIGKRAISSFDPNSGSQAWRVSIWSSAWHMGLDRPILGWGPNSFRLAYPPYRGVELADEASGPLVVTNAHNVVLNTLAEGGVLAAFALPIWAAILAWEVMAARRRGCLDQLLPFATATAAGLVGLQFHFLTLDTGPLFAVVIAETTMLANSTVEHVSKHASTKPSRASQHRWTAVMVAVLALLLVAGAFGLVVADRQLGHGFAAAADGQPWEVVRAPFEAAQKAAPWEPSFTWASGQVATQVLGKTPSTFAFADGDVALTEAQERLPYDLRLQEDHANLYLAAGLSGVDVDAFALARTEYENLIKIDPNNGTLWLGMGSAEAGLGDWQSAVNAYEHGVELMQRSALGWSNLSIAYEQVGRAEDAEEARTKAAELQREIDETASGTE